ncbi:MAG: hypothetical protein FWH33_07825 [Oscillospiraceae bacterium]|nr:hypothetical protein [Oscillospiraceae bacterium]
MRAGRKTPTKPITSEPEPERPAAQTAEQVDASRCGRVKAESLCIPDGDVSSLLRWRESAI